MNLTATTENKVGLINHDTDVNFNNNRLPTEVLIKCFSYLDIIDIPAVSLVCQTWSQVASSSYNWFSFYKKIVKVTERDPSKNYKTLFKNMRHVPFDKGTEVSDSVRQSCFGLDVSQNFSVVNVLRYQNNCLLTLEEIDRRSNGYVYHFSAFSFLPVPTGNGLVLTFLSNDPKATVQTLHQSYLRVTFRVPCSILDKVKSQLYFKMRTHYHFGIDKGVTETLKDLCNTDTPIDKISKQISKGFVNIGRQANIITDNTTVEIPPAPQPRRRL